LVRIVAKLYGWEKVRGVRYTPSAANLPQTKKTRLWLEQTPLVFAWITSDRFLVAPERFPVLVEQLMLPFPLSPYLMSFYVLNKTKNDLRDCMLLAYCVGLTPQEIGLMLDCSEEQVVFCMQEAVQQYLQDPRFKLWSWGLDWTSVIIPSDVDESILTRLGIKDILMSQGQFDIQTGSDEYRRLEIIANSSRMQRIALYAPKNPARVPAAWLIQGLARHGTTQQATE